MNKYVLFGLFALLATGPCAWAAPEAFAQGWQERLDQEVKRQWSGNENYRKAAALILQMQSELRQNDCQESREEWTERLKDMLQSGAVPLSDEQKGENLWFYVRSTPVGEVFENVVVNYRKKGFLRLLNRPAWTVRVRGDEADYFGYGYTPLEHAVLEQNTDAVSFFLSRNVPVYTDFIEEALSRSTASIRELLKKPLAQAQKESERAKELFLPFQNSSLALAARAALLTEFNKMLEETAAKLKESKTLGSGALARAYYAAPWGKGKNTFVCELVYASGKSQPEPEVARALRALSKAGADMDHPCANGYLPMEIARYFKNEAMLELLKESRSLDTGRAALFNVTAYSLPVPQIKTSKPAKEEIPACLRWPDTTRAERPDVSAMLRYMTETFRP